MKVLVVSLFHPEIVRGGAQQIAYELFKALRQQPGIEATLLASVDETHSAFYRAGARITGFDGRPGEFLFLSRGYDHTWHRVRDDLLVRAYAEFLQQVRPDVVHFHHYLTFGVELLTLTRRVLPQARIVFTLHEFVSICAADGQMLRLTDGSLCDTASSVRCHQCLPSLPPEHFFLRKVWIQRHLEVVDLFTVPSRFMIARYVDWGLPEGRIVYVSNGQPHYGSVLPPPLPGQPRNRFGYFGQIVDNKGVWLLLEAVTLLRSEGFIDFQVEINGANLNFASAARRAEFEAFMAREQAMPPVERKVAFNGSYEVGRLRERMSRVDWCVVPSVWWEAFGLVVSEAWMFGRPVIAADVGGLAERIGHEHDGLLFAVGDVRALASALRRAATERQLWDRLARNVPQPPSSEMMLTAFLSIYRDGNQTIRLSSSIPF